MLVGVSVVDPDGVVSQQSHLMQQLSPTFVATAPPVSRFRYFMPRRELDGLARQLAAARGRVVLLGRGSFHHLTAALVRACTLPLPFPGGGRVVDPPETVDLVVVDAHADWAPAPAGYLHCGSWVAEVLAMPRVGQVILVGVGGLRALGLLNPTVLRRVGPAAREGRLWVYPAGSATAGELAESLYPGRLLLSLEDPPERVVRDLAARVRGRHVYLSVDKDVLLADEAPGCWPGGQVPARVLFRLVEGLMGAVEPERWVGADICGEWEGWGPLYQGQQAAAMHEAINLQLLRLLLQPVARRPAAA